MKAAAREHSPDQLAAHDLLSELRTRIATQPLPYQYGVEARALESLWEIFALARKAMKDHPGCVEFARLTTTMLNVDLRPVTAKWHRAHQAGVLNSKDGAAEFRAELAAVQTRLVTFANTLQQMAYGTQVPDEVAPSVLNEEEINRCFEPVSFGIGTNWCGGHRELQGDRPRGGGGSCKPTPALRDTKARRHGRRRAVAVRGGVSGRQPSA